MKTAAVTDPATTRPPRTSCEAAAPRRTIVCVALLLSVAAVLSVGLATVSHAAAPAAGAPDTAAANTPSPVGAFRSVRTYAEVAEPVRLRIPAIGVDTPLVRLGRAADHTIAVPSDYHTAGWFDEGPRPGQPGPAVILGHVDSKAGPGVFFALGRLTPGAEVSVDRADGSAVRFRVQRTMRVPKTEFPTDLVYAPTLEASLRLVTCGGGFDHAKGSYLDNVIVYADPVA
jgi:sortase (surface protein transpeptidase)